MTVPRAAIAVTDRSRSYRIDVRLVRRAAAAVLRHLRRTRGVALDIVFLDDTAIRVLNRRYKKHDRATDVLSFPLEGEAFGVDGLVGQIFISAERAVAQAAAYGATVSDELIRYVIHGVLHLVGYDDRTREARARMSRKEDRVLAWLATKEDLSRVLTPR